MIKLFFSLFLCEKMIMKKKDFFYTTSLFFIHHCYYFHFSFHQVRCEDSPQAL